MKRYGTGVRPFTSLAKYLFTGGAALLPVVAVTTFLLSGFVASPAFARTQFRSAFPSVVTVGHPLSVSVSVPAGMQGAGLLLQQRVAKRWVTRAQRRAGRTKTVVLTWVPSTAGTLVMRVDVTKAGRDAWTSKDVRVDIAATAPGGAAATGCPAGDSGSPPDCLTPIPATCPPGRSVTLPNCLTPIAPTCPSGQVGTPPNCEPPPPNPDRGDTLSSGETLQPGWYLQSSDGNYELVMQSSDGNLVLYHEHSAVWATYTSGHGNYLTMQPEGNLVVYNGGEAKWDTVTWGFPGAYLQLQDDGNLVLYQDGHAIWTYGSGYKGQILNPGEDLQPGAYLLSPDHEYELIMQTDGNLVLYRSGSALWSSQTGGDTGAYAVMQPEGNLVIYREGVAVWSSSTWGFPGAYLQLQDDSNAVIYQSGHPVWDWMSGYIGDQLNQWKLEPGAYLLSPNHEYELIMQTDGNLVLYHGGTALWSSQTGGDIGAYAVMQPDGNFVIYTGGSARWSTGTAGYSGAYLDVQNDSNVVVYQGGTALWDWASGRLGGGGGGGQGQAIVEEAAKWAGTQYCWDGGNESGPTPGTADPTDGGYQCAPGTVGFDCTGLTIYAVYQVTGIKLSHDPEQATSAPGQTIPHESELEPGDIVYFGGTLDDNDHAGVYAGVINGTPSFWSAVTEGIGVKLETMKWEEAANGFVGGVRFWH